jgi:hypothetical protein
MFKKLLFVLVALVIGFVGGAYLIDSEVQVTRSVVIAAPAAEIHPWVDDFKRFDEWATFDDQDPDLVYHWNEQTGGVGASRSWDSEAMGNGGQTITKSVVDEGVWMDLHFEGFDDPAKIAITFQQVDGGTEVTWTDDLDMGNNPVFRWMGLAMDGMLGATFEESLANLKTEVEGAGTTG